jgi:hypothetical protein
MINRTIPSGRENWLCHRAGIFVKRSDAMLSRSVAGYKPRHDKFAKASSLVAGVGDRRFSKKGSSLKSDNFKAVSYQRQELQLPCPACRTDRVRANETA